MPSWSISPAWATGVSPSPAVDAWATSLLDLGQPPTAVVCATDVLARGALHEAHKRGLRVPEDLSITGFDDIPMAAYAVPALTTVCMPVREMVAAAVAMVIDRDAKEPAPPVNPILAPSLVVRASTAAPPR